MDEQQINLLRSYAQFEQSLKVLENRQLAAISSFADRAATRRIQEVREKLDGTRKADETEYDS